MRNKLKTRILLLLTAGLLLLTGMALPTAAADESEAALTTYDMAGKRVGNLTGAVTESMVTGFFDGDVNIEYFNANADMALAVEEGKLDAYVCDLITARRLCAVYTDQVVLEPDVKDCDLGFVFNKDNPESVELCGKMREFIERCRTDGTIAELEDKWMCIDPGDASVDIELTGENGTLTWACCTSIGQPWCYLQNGEYAGFEVELATRFCQENGYALEFMDFDIGGMINAVLLGKCDFAGTATNITQERLEIVLFSGVSYTNRFVLIAKAGSAAAEAGGGVLSSYDLAGQKVGCLSAAPTADMVRKFFNGDVTVEYFNFDSDLAYAAEHDIVPAFISNSISAQRACLLYPNLTILAPDVAAYDISFMFRKDDPEAAALCEKMSAFIEELRADGTLDTLDKKWMCPEPDGADIDIELTGENGTLTWACTTNIGQPWVYVQDGKYVGYETEIAMLFCQKYGYNLEIMDYDLGGMQNAVELGKCDFGGTSTFSVPEAEENFLFSAPHYLCHFVLVAKGGAAAADAKGGFFRSVASSFERTFLREARWKLFAAGIGRTLAITACSVLFGTLLGFGAYLLCRRGNRFANAVTGFMTWLINGLPTVVLLMILFYVVFGKLNINGLWVSVVAFTLIFAAAFQAMLRSGVGAVDYGQTEAAYALSYSDRETFFKIVLPQAVLHFLPAYKAQVVALLKATSIVGYITVQDLTKVGEIIRASTYEAFFPLIAIAVVYFLMAAVLIALVNAVTINTDKRRRTSDDILKGVNQHD